MGKADEKRDALESKQQSYLARLRKLGKELTAIRDYRGKEEEKLIQKQERYESKLKKIDERLQEL